MAKYGNILTVFDADQTKKDEIILILRNSGAEFENINDTFYIESNSKANTKAITDALMASGARFIFFHNNISDGSLIKAQNIHQSLVEKINHILFE